MTEKDARQFAWALDGLIRSRTKGHGGEEYARKCINEIADALTDKDPMKGITKHGVSIEHDSH